MIDPCTARSASPADIEQIAGLVRQCVAELEPQRGGAMWSVTAARIEPIDERLSHEIHDPDMLVVVGEYERSIVGYSVCELCATTDGRSYARVTDLFTLEGARHVGVGESMMDACIQWARDHSAFAIDASVLPGTRDAKNFFEGFGLTARALTVSKQL
jgi:GNAT superfamily N-acetyltransferase